MSKLIELVSEIVTSHASTSPLTSEQLVQEIQQVYSALKALEEGNTEVTVVEEEVKPAITVKEAFKKNEVICMLCNKGGFKTLTRHLSTTHNMKPGEYRKQFGISSKQSLSAKSYSESRRKMAQERGLADNLAKARAAKMAAKKPVTSKEPKTSKVSKPVAKTKAAAPKK